ncbi:MAG TPA: hypothetical protein V6C58_01250, partial [Allocoleopsis sp.]
MWINHGHFFLNNQWQLTELIDSYFNTFRIKHYGENNTILYLPCYICQSSDNNEIYSVRKIYFNQLWQLYDLRSPKHWTNRKIGFKGIRDVADYPLWTIDIELENSVRLPSEFAIGSIYIELTVNSISPILLSVNNVGRLGGIINNNSEGNLFIGLTNNLNT